MSELISSVPTNLAPAGTSYQTYERVPMHYATRTESLGELHTQLLTSLGNELNWGSPEQTDALAEHAYSVARQIGDSEIVNRSRSAGSLLEETRGSARVNTTFRGESDSDGHVTYRRGEDTVVKEYALGISNVFEKRPYIKRTLAERGVALQEGHVGLLMLMQVAGHEAGHMIQTGIASSLYSPDISYLSHISLAYQSDQKLTEHSKTAAMIRDEQFAEGYGNLVLERAARDLGYDDATISAVLEALAIPAESLPTVGMLADVTEQMGLKEIAQSRGIEKPNVGEVGYTQPLSANQVVRDLEIMSATLRGEPLPAASVAPETLNDTIEIQQTKHRFFARVIDKLRQ